MYHRTYKFIFVFALVLGIGVGLLMNLHTTAQAQEMAGQQFTVQAGGYGPSNVEVLAFAPLNLQVHRGDTVTWVETGFHNIRFAEENIDLVIAPEVDGQPLPQVNPGVAFPTIENGATYSGGDANSGLPVPPNEFTTFSLVMDMEPGAYSYLCDVHPGMNGIITVVEDDVEIASPGEVAFNASSTLVETAGNAFGVSIELEAAAPTEAVDGVFEVQVGNGDTGRATINEYFPFDAAITVGESVTWTIPATSVEPHTVSWPPARGQDVAPIEQEGGPPILALGPSIAPMTESGTAVNVGDGYSSGLFFPGQSFSLTFNEPGNYAYVCNIHPGMSGVITVLPAGE
jgi:plastocyanin